MARCRRRRTNQISQRLQAHPTHFARRQTDGQKEWVDRKCDQFFCKHHHRTGKGKYKCEPLAIPEEHLLALDNPGP